MQAPGYLDCAKPTTTPTGVEHIRPNGPSVNATAAKPTMTPTGVEHLLGQVERCRSGDTKLTMTPTGVEHSIWRYVSVRPRLRNRPIPDSGRCNQRLRETHSFPTA